MRNSIQISVFILWIAFFGNARAQDPFMDSLKAVLKDASHDTTRCRILNVMIETEGDENIWLGYNTEMAKLAEKGIASSTAELKTIYTRYLAHSFNNSGYLDNIRGNSAAAMQNYKKALTLYESIDDKVGISSILNNLGFIYSQYGDISKALEQYLKCLKLREELHNMNGIATSLNNIAMVYSKQGDKIKALEYYNRSLEAYEASNNKDGMSYAYNNIGVYYDDIGNYDKALQYYTEALKLQEETNDKRGIAASLNNIGLIYHNRKQYKEALEYYQKGLEVHLELEDRSGYSLSNCNIANVLYTQGKLDEALKYAGKGLQVAKELGFPDNINRLANTMKVIYKKQNKLKEAYEMFRLEIGMRDSVNNSETRKEIMRKELQYAYEKQSVQDSIRHTEAQKVNDAQLNAQEAELKQERTQRMVLYGGLTLVVFFIAIVFNRFKVTQKQKAIIGNQKREVDIAYEKLHEKNKEVMDSIHYAKRIQTSLLPNNTYISKELGRLKS